MSSAAVVIGALRVNLEIPYLLAVLLTFNTLHAGKIFQQMTFWNERGFDTMQIVSLGDNSHEMSDPIH